MLAGFQQEELANQMKPVVMGKGGMVSRVPTDFLASLRLGMLEPAPNVVWSNAGWPSGPWEIRSCH